MQIQGLRTSPPHWSRPATAAANDRYVRGGPGPDLIPAPASRPADRIRAAVTVSEPHDTEYPFGPLTLKARFQPGPSVDDATLCQRHQSLKDRLANSAGRDFAPAGEDLDGQALDALKIELFSLPEEQKADYERILDKLADPWMALGYVTAVHGLPEERRGPLEAFFWRKMDIGREQARAHAERNGLDLGSGPAPGYGWDERQLVGGYLDNLILFDSVRRDGEDFASHHAQVEKIWDLAWSRDKVPLLGLRDAVRICGKHREGSMMESYQRMIRFWQPAAEKGLGFGQAMALYESLGEKAQGLIGPAAAWVAETALPGEVVPAVLRAASQRTEKTEDFPRWLEHYAHLAELGGDPEFMERLRERAVRDFGPDQAEAAMAEVAREVRVRRLHGDEPAQAAENAYLMVRERRQGDSGNEVLVREDGVWIGGARVKRRKLPRPT